MSCGCRAQGGLARPLPEGRCSTTNFNEERIMKKMRKVAIYGKGGLGKSCCGSGDGC